MSLQDGEVLEKGEAAVVVREGFLEEVPPELDLEIGLGVHQAEKPRKRECSVCALKASQWKNLLTSFLIPTDLEGYSII